MENQHSADIYSDTEVGIALTLRTAGSTPSRTVQSLIMSFWFPVLVWLDWVGGVFLCFFMFPFGPSSFGISASTKPSTITNQNMKIQQNSKCTARPWSVPLGIPLPALKSSETDLWEHGLNAKVMHRRKIPGPKTLPFYFISRRVVTFD